MEELFEFDSQEYTLTEVQEAAKAKSLNIDDYIKEYNISRKPGKTTPPKEDNQGVPAEVNAAPEIGMLDLDSNLVNTLLESPNKETQKQFLSLVENFHKDDFNNHLKSLLKKYDAGFLTNNNKINPGLNAVDSAIYKERLNKVNKEYNNFYNDIAQKEYESLLNDKAKEFEAFDPTSGLTIGQNFALGVAKTFESLFDIGEEGISKGPLLNAKDAFSAAKKLDAYSAAEKNIEARKQRIIQQGQDEGWNDKVLQQQLNFFTDPTNSTGKKIANGEEKYKDFLKINKANASLEMLSKLAKADQQFLQLFENYGPDSEIIDENGNINLTFGKTARFTGQQFTQLLFSAATAPIAPGRATYMQEIGPMMTEALEQAAIKEFGEEAIAKMDDGTKQEKYVTLIEEGKLDLSKLETSAIFSGLLDTAGTVFQGIKIAKAGAPLLRNIFKRKFQETLKIAVSKGADVGLATAGETLTEIAQEGLNVMGVAEAAGTKQNWAGKRFGEVGLQTLITTPLLVGGGRGVKSGTNQLKRLIQGAYDPNSLRAEINNQIKVVNMLEESKKIGSEQAANEIDNLYATEDIISNSIYNKFEPEAKAEMIDILAKEKGIKRKIDKLKNTYDADSVFSAGQVKALEEELKETENKKEEVKGLQNYLVSQKSLLKHINNNPEKYNNYKVFSFDTNDELVAFAKRNNISNEVIKNILGTKEEILLDEDGKILPESDKKEDFAFGAEIPSQKIFILSKENVKKATGLNKIIGGNVIHHELGHVIMSSLSDKDINNFIKNIRIEAERLPENSKLKEAFQLAKKRVKTSYSDQSNRVKSEEILTSMSDFLRALNPNDILVDDASLLSKTFSFLAEKLNLATSEQIDFSGLAEPQQALQFLQKYNKSLGNSKNLFQRIKKVSITSAKPEVADEIEKFSKSISGDNIQKIFDEKGKDGAFDIIEAYKPLTTKLTNKYRDVPGFDFELLQSEIEIGKRGLLDLINAYDPSKGATLNTYVQGQLANRSIEAANRILDTEFKLDVTEAKGVTDTTTEETIEAAEEAEFADEIKSLRKEIGLSEELVNTVKTAVIKTFGTKLPNPQDPKFRLELQKRFRTELKKPIAKFVGKQADYESFLRDNFQSIYNKLPQSLINRRFKDFQEPVLDKNGKHVREKTAEGNKVYTKKKISKAEFIKYFLGSEVGRSTQGTRKTAIVEAVAEEIAFDATMEVLNDPAVIQKYQDIAGITGEVLPENFKSIIAKQVDRAENFKFSKSVANNAKAEYNLESQELGRILDKTSLDKLSDKYSLISDAIIYEADPNNIKFSLTTKADGKWEQNALNPLDESAKLYKFKVGEVDYEINTFKDRYAFNYDIFESTMGIQDEFVSNDPKSWAMAFADALDGSTDLTGVATQGLTNQFKVFGTVANATIDLIKKEKLNSITFSGKEKSRKRLYRSLSDKFAKELGWEAYDFEAQLASGAETVFIVYNPKAFPAEEEVNKDFAIKFSKTSATKSEVKFITKAAMATGVDSNLAIDIFNKAVTLGVESQEFKNYINKIKIPKKKEFLDRLIQEGIIQSIQDAQARNNGIKYEKGLTKFLKRIYGNNVKVELIKARKGDLKITINGVGRIIELKLNKNAQFGSLSFSNLFSNNGFNKNFTISKDIQLKNEINDFVNNNKIYFDNFWKAIKVTEKQTGQKITITKTGNIKLPSKNFWEQVRDNMPDNIFGTISFESNSNIVYDLYKGTEVDLIQIGSSKNYKGGMFRIGEINSFNRSYSDFKATMNNVIRPVRTGETIYFRLFPNIKQIKSAPKNSLETSDGMRFFYESIENNIPKKLSKSLNKEFNTILEQSSGIKATKKFSPVEARIAGKGKGKLKLFIPYSADDFVGLLYTTLSSGKAGDQQIDWYRENLLRPFSRGIQQYEAAKQNALREWQILKKEAKKSVPGGLNKKNASGLTNQEAVRLYIWKQQGMEIPGTKGSAAFVNENLKTVRKNPELKAFAERLMALNPEGYPAPSDNWDSGDITTDLVSYIDGVKRSEFLTEFKDNAAKIFSDSNKEKLRALYGDNFIEALDDILHRMKTGTNRKFGASKIERQFMDWTNNSVGAIMFFNARSAVLQTLSAVNFINFTDNNPINAAIAFGNFPQYVKDFSTLFNSDFLKQRRTGLQTDVNADEIARAAKGAKNTARAMLSAILKFGFTPTQIADSFAIASGGATFYRNRINKYKKEGLSQQEAETKAFTDFQEIAEETQQSARPDRISLQQASSLGRLILAFGNTPMQYARLTKKASLDLINGRGDWKTNMSKIMYYSVIQNIIFSALQQGLFALLFDDEDDDKEKSRLFRIGNSSLDTFLRGSGVYGAAAATAKNMILKVIEESEKSRPDYTKVAIEATALSPPINSKLRKLVSAGKTFTYKQSKEKVFTEGFSLENPAFLAGGQVVSALTNLPADRVVLKADHLKTAIEPETELWQSLALTLGWSEWDLNMIQNQTKKESNFKIKPFKTKGLKIKKFKK